MTEEEIRECGSGVLVAAAQCEDHPLDISQGDVERYIYAATGCCCWPVKCEDYCDTWGVTVLQTKDRRFAVVTEWADTTGHG